MRKEKQFLLDEIQEKFAGSKAILVTRYGKLTPNASWQLRDQLSKSGNLFEVVKKRVFVKAAEAAGLKVDLAQLEGHIGVVFVGEEDILPAAKTVLKFAEENPETIAVLMGQVEGKMLPGHEVVALSKLPGINDMRSIMLSLFVSPMSQLLSVFEAKADATAEQANG